MASQSQARAPYDYKVTNRDGDYIRLLQLSDHSDHGDSADVYCSLDVFKLEYAPSYIAVSYAWGLDAKSTTLHVGGRSMSMRVTPNAASAINAIGKVYGRPWIWIDTICINQEDRDEKAAQVAIMDRIFAQASTVVVWLGGAEAPDTIQWMPESFSLDAVFENLSDDGPHSWWRRLWCVQEVAVAARVYVCVGRYVVGFEQITNAIAGDSYWRSLPAVTDERETLSRRIFTRQVMTLRNVRKAVQRNVDVDILTLLEATQLCYVTLAEDRIYALLGLASWEDKQQIQVEYSQEKVQPFLDLATELHGERVQVRFSDATAVTFARFAVHMIRKTRSFDVLFREWPRWNSPTNPDSDSGGSYPLPSWVPDYTQSVKREALLVSAAAYQGLPERLPDIELVRRPRHEGGMQLEVRGVLMGTISAVYAQSSDAPQIPRVPTTAVGDEGPSNPFKALSIAARGEQDMAVFHERAAGRTLFTTGTGLVGFTAAAVMHAHVIFFPPGSRLPWILQKVDDVADNVYLLGDECYIHGLGEGELGHLVRSGTVEAETVILV